MSCDTKWAQSTADFKVIFYFLVEPIEPRNQPVDKYVFWGNLAKGQKVKTFLNYGKEYEVELKLKLKHENALNHGTEYLNILQIAKGGWQGVGAPILHGDRIPAIFVSAGEFAFREHS